MGIIGIHITLITFITLITLITLIKNKKPENDSLVFILS